MFKKILIGIVILISAALVVFSFNQSKGLHEHTDYYVFYHAGQHFASGEDLYVADENVRPFLYPPFAAFIFQTLSILPVRISANVFFLLNYFVLLPLVLYLLLKTVRNFGFAARVKTALIFSAVCSAHFFWSNLAMFQMNLFVFTICTLGIWFYSRKLYHFAAVCFVIASFIKVLPVFFLLFVVLSNLKSRKVFLYTTITVVLCLAVSIIPRGIQTGINDHFSYYSAFLKEFKEGRVITTNSNHTLKSLVLKAFYPETRNVEDVNLLLYKKPMLIANMMLLLLAGLTTGMCVYARKTKKKVNYLIIFSLIFIFTHLISGITWTAHLVTAMFWYLPLFIVDVRKITHTAHKMLHYLFYAMAFFLTVEGKDTTGEFLYNVLSFYDVLVIFPLVLFFYYIYLEFSHFRFIEYSHA